MEKKRVAPSVFKPHLFEETQCGNTHNRATPHALSYQYPHFGTAIDTALTVSRRY